ncbi:unnamed protein product [Boreogadus saida]
MELFHLCMQVYQQHLAGVSLALAENLRTENRSFAQFLERVLPAMMGHVQLPLRSLKMMEMATPLRWTLSQ